MQPATLSLTAIGIFKSPQKVAYQAGRQPDELGAVGEIQLFPGMNYEQALLDLEGCSHIWIIFGFHQNNNWKPQVQTPRSDRKIGVFATRAPYRPNPLGLSLVKLLSVDRLTVLVSKNDILDGSPVYDIKPYHPESDVADDPQILWLEDSVVEKFEISISPVAEEQFDWFEQNRLAEIKTFVLRQLEYDPVNQNKKRVTQNLGYWTLAYRTWRIDFTVTENNIGVLAVHSGYTSAELQNNDDNLNDKSLHRSFTKYFE